jgi:hypothetical protein
MRAGSQTKPITQWLRQDQAPRLVDRQRAHTIDDGKWYSKCQQRMTGRTAARARLAC